MARQIITSSPRRWISVKFRRIIASCAAVVGNGTLLMSSNFFGSKKSAGPVCGRKCRPSMSRLIVISFWLAFLVNRKVVSISDDARHGLVYVDILDEMGISIMYCFTSALFVVRIASGVMSSIIVSRIMAIASCLIATLVSSSNSRSSSVPETTWA